MAIILFALRAIPVSRPTAAQIQEKITAQYFNKTQIKSLEYITTSNGLEYGVCKTESKLTTVDGTVHEDNSISVSVDTLRAWSRMMALKFSDSVSSAVAFNAIYTADSGLIPEEMNIFEVSGMLSDYYHKVSETVKHMALIRKVLN